MIQVSNNNPFISGDYAEFLAGGIKIGQAPVNSVLSATLRAMMSSRENARLDIYSDGHFRFKTPDNSLFIFEDSFSAGTPIPEPFQELRDVGLYLSTEKCPATVFIDETAHRCIVCSPNSYRSNFQARMTCVLSRLVPWLFEGGLTDIDRKLIYAIDKDDQMAYNETMAQIIAELNLRELKIRAALAGFENKGKEVRAKSLERAVESARTDLYRIMRQYNDKNADLTNLMRELSAFRCHLEDSGDSNELMNFFLSAKTLELVKVEGMDIHFVVKTYLTQYDEDYFYDLVDNKDTFMYDDVCEDYAVDDFEKLMRAIFETNEIKCRVFACFKISNYSEFNVTHAYGSVDVSSYLPHPHLDRYTCDGDNGRIIQQRLMEQDVIGAIEQCISATSNINFYDSTVVSSFVREDLCADNNYRFLELPDGSLVNPSEAIDWLRTKEVK